MKIDRMKKVVARATQDLAPRVKILKSEAAKYKPTLDRVALRISRLADEGRQPSISEKERILGSNDLVDLNFFERGLAAARAVCRIILRDSAGRQIGVASGFMVSARLLLTNHHVFPAAEEASNALAQFGYTLDINGIEQRGPSFPIKPADYFFNDEALDFALVAVGERPEGSSSGKLSDWGALRLNPLTGKINEGEFVSIIQHPSGLPKQVALRENKLLKIENLYLVYTSDTAQGSSGSPLFNDSWQVVGLHSAGVPRKNATGQWLTKSGAIANDETEDSEIDWVANRGARASEIIKALTKAPRSPLLDELSTFAQETGALASTTKQHIKDAEREALVRRGVVSGLRITPQEGGVSIDLPVGFSASLVGGDLPRAEEPSTGAVQQTQSGVSGDGAEEAYKQPYIERPYGNRKGYAPDFLGPRVPLPRLASSKIAARMLDGSGYVIPYEHFSIVMHKERRLAIFTAASIDGSKKAKQPEAGRSYTRDALGDLKKGDVEKWLADERIDPNEQLPDVFFKNDRKAFDKGHILRREDAAWGKTYKQVRRANGDTYHVTNCSPQVAAFNQSSKGGIWGLLENAIQQQTKTEKLILFAGPIFTKKDKVFEGVDDDGGKLRIPIPSKFWKVVIAKPEDGPLQSFAFVLEQDLSSVVWEFSVDDEWREYMEPLEKLQEKLDLTFPANVLRGDQHGTAAADEVMRFANEAAAY